MLRPHNIFIAGLYCSAYAVIADFLMLYILGLANSGIAPVKTFIYPVTFKNVAA